jgi:hypothetical protein
VRDATNVAARRAGKRDALKVVVNACMLCYTRGDMQSSHPYAIQAAAFYVALVPFIALFAVMMGGRYFEGLRRKRKPAARKPAVSALRVPT